MNYYMRMPDLHVVGAGGTQARSPLLHIRRRAGAGAWDFYFLAVIDSVDCADVAVQGVAALQSEISSRPC